MQTEDPAKANPRTKRLPLEKRHEMILKALDPENSITKIADEYGVLRITIYQHINRVVQDPEQQMKDAEAEATFRRKVYEMTR